MQEIKKIENCVKVNDSESSVFNKTAQPILERIDNIINNNSEEEYDFLDLLKSLEDHYIDSSILEQTKQMRTAFKNIIELPFHCNNDVLYDFDNKLFEELSYCLKSNKKGGKGYFGSFKQFEKFLGVTQGSIHQVIFNKTYNFKKVNTRSYYKLIRFLQLYSNVQELNNDLLTSSKLWNNNNSKTKLEYIEFRKEIFKAIDKSSYLDEVSSNKG